jgi:peptidoglycan/xylan/chitin deacetylase (PgdA/CDA1 family)
MAELSLVTSWDDGDPTDMRLAECLARHAVPATFFVPVRNREGRAVLQPAALRGLAEAGFEIGAHTLDHCRLSHLSRRDARHQIADGKHRLEDAIGSDVSGFAYPGGHPGLYGRAVAAEVGFRYARTNRMFCLSPGSDPFRIGTTAQFYPHRCGALMRNWLRGGGTFARLGLARRWMRADGFEHAIETVVALAAARGGVFHLWGHSWEIEAAGLWPILDRTLAGLAKAVPTTARATVRQLVSCAS